MTNEGPALTIGTWQDGHRAEGLGSMHRILPNLMVVNAQEVFAVNHQARDYSLHEIPSVARVLAHPAISSVVVMTETGDVLLEHQRPGHDRRSTFSDQSSTKSMGYLLLGAALREGVLALEDPIEKHVPEVGPGFRDRTVADVAAMAVNHNVAELAAYQGDPAALAMFDRDERAIGLRPNDNRETLREFIGAIEPGTGGTTEWHGEIANYATINTSVLGFAVEHATQIPLSEQVRRLLHRIGGENPVAIGTDFAGVPVIGAGLVSATVDFARYGRLLLEDKDQVLHDREAAWVSGEVVPADLTHVESRYYKSAMHNEFGIGHSGWGGQLLWADPESAVVVAVNSQLASRLPAPFDFFEPVYQAAYDIVARRRETGTD
jgi:CubicO group peptidase (beta-lactamase class C family)